MDIPSSCVLPTQAIVDCIDGYVRDNDLNPTVTDPLVVDHQVTISWPVVLSLMTIIASYLRNVPSIQSEQSFFGANFRMIVFIYMAYNWMLALSVTMEEIIVTKNLGLVGRIGTDSVIIPTFFVDMIRASVLSQQSVDIQLESTQPLATNSYYATFKWVRPEWNQSEVLADHVDNLVSIITQIYPTSSKATSSLKIFFNFLYGADTQSNFKLELNKSDISGSGIRAVISFIDRFRNFEAYCSDTFFLKGDYLKPLQYRSAFTGGEVIKHLMSIETMVINTSLDLSPRALNLSRLFPIGMVTKKRSKKPQLVVSTHSDLRKTRNAGFSHSCIGCFAVFSNSFYANTDIEPYIGDELSKLNIRPALGYSLIARYICQFIFGINIQPIQFKLITPPFRTLAPGTKFTPEYEDGRYITYSYSSPDTFLPVSRFIKPVDDIRLIDGKAMVDDSANGNDAAVDAKGNEQSPPAPATAATSPKLSDGQDSAIATVQTTAATGPQPAATDADGARAQTAASQATTVQPAAAQDAVGQAPPAKPVIAPANPPADDSNKSKGKKAIGTSNLNVKHSSIFGSSTKSIFCGQTFNLIKSSRIVMNSKNELSELNARIQRLEELNKQRMLVTNYRAKSLVSKGIDPTFHLETFKRIKGGFKKKFTLLESCQQDSYSFFIMMEHNIHRFHYELSEVWYGQGSYLWMIEYIIKFAIETPPTKHFSLFMNKDQYASSQFSILIRNNKLGVDIDKSAIYDYVYNCDKVEEVSSLNRLKLGSIIKKYLITTSDNTYFVIVKFQNRLMNN
jgi:hypothetical protein